MRQKIIIAAVVLMIVLVAIAVISILAQTPALI